jgi:hypothetical protein
LRVCESRILRKFGPKREEVGGDWRKLRNKELYGLYSSPAIVKVMNSRAINGHVRGRREMLTEFR